MESSFERATATVKLIIYYGVEFSQVAYYDLSSTWRNFTFWLLFFFYRTTFQIEVTTVIKRLQGRDSLKRHSAFV